MKGMLRAAFLIIAGAASLLEGNAGESVKHTESWLFIGDSHSVRGFGDGLREELFRLRPVSEGRFHQYSVSGSTLEHWMKGSFDGLRINNARKIPGQEKSVIEGAPPSDFEALPVLLERHSATHVIIALGTNDFVQISNRMRGEEKLPVDEAMKRAFQRLPDLLARLEGKRCFWILPPALRVPRPGPALQEKLEKKLSQAIGTRCTLIPSRWTSPDQKDGVHFNREKGLEWGRESARKILNTLSRD